MMGKMQKVAMADILIRAGFDPLKCLELCRVPVVVSIRVSATASDEHRARLVKKTGQRNIESKVVHEIKSAPQESYVESYVKHDGVGSWSISRSRLDVKYSNRATASLFFGERASGSFLDNKMPKTHRLSLPIAPGWPELKSIPAQYPAPAE